MAYLLAFFARGGWKEEAKLFHQAVQSKLETLSLITLVTIDFKYPNLKYHLLYIYVTINYELNLGMYKSVLGPRSLLSGLAH